MRALYPRRYRRRPIILRPYAGAQIAFSVTTSTLTLKEVSLTSCVQIASGGTLVPTPEECRHRAEALVKLAALATQLYAREMLLERAAEFRQMAESTSGDALRLCVRRSRLA